MRLLYCTNVEKNEKFSRGYVIFLDLLSLKNDKNIGVKVFSGFYLVFI